MTSLSHSGDPEFESQRAHITKSIYTENNNLLKGGRMETKNIALAVIMTLSSIVLTYKWLARLGDSDPVILLSAMLLIGSLAGMILFVNTRIQRLEEALDAKERSIRINIKGVEDNLEKKMDAYVQKTNNQIGEFSKRIYR